MNNFSPKQQMIVDEDIIYLNHAAIGPLPKSSRELLNKIYSGFARKGSASIDLEELEDLWDQTRTTIAELLHGEPEGVTITTNTTSGLHLVADMLSQEVTKDSNFVIPEIEFTANSYVWQKFAQRNNVELRTVSFADQRLQKWDDVIDDNTEFISASIVQFSNGYKFDLDYLSSLAHEHEAYLAIDAIQGLGVIPFDQITSKVDFIASGCYKWLLGPMGTGLFYVDPDLIGHLDSILVGWFGDKSFHEMSHHKFDPWDDARRYQQYLSPVFEVIKNSLDIILEWGPQNTLEHIIKLQNHLIRGLEDTNYTVDSNLDYIHRSGIIKFNHDQAETIVKHLGEENIIVSYRNNGIRISPHRYNSRDEINRLIKYLKHFDQ